MEQFHESEETEEREEYTTIYKVSRRKHTRTRSSRKPKTPVVPSLSPFLEGHLPKVVNNPLKQPDSTKANFVTDFIRENLQDLDRELILSSRKQKFFLGECSDDEDGTIYDKVSRDDLAVLRKVKIWTVKHTGRQAFDKFRRSVEFVRFARKICRRETGQTLSQEQSVLFFVGTKPVRPDTPTSSDPRALFDVTPFQALGQKNFVNTIRKCLEVLPEKRPDSDITAMMHLLRKFSKFSSYPRHVQEGICRKGWYSRFDKARVLARQGNRSDFYYFILSGIVVSRYLDCNENGGAKINQAAEFKRQGDIIGEKEILTGSERPMTIVCKEPVEVIGLDKDELLSLFQFCGAPECINFLNTVPDLSGFPFQLLQRYHFSCSVHHYRRGAVIVKDSNESEWIYVIKSGSCQVYECVTQSKGKSAKPVLTKRRSDDGFLPDITNKLHLDRRRSLSSAEIDSPRKMKAKPSSLTRQKSVLPTINKGNNNFVTQKNSSPEPTTKKKTRSSKHSPRADLTVPSDKKQTHYVKLDIITERECFGIQSLLYTNLPSLSLVSNGAECVLLSKQFFRDHMDADLKRKLIYRIPPYPSNSRVREAVEDKILWETYKSQVLNETLNG